MSYQVNETTTTTLVGGCGVEGCLDCLPLFLVKNDGTQSELKEGELA